MFDIIILHSDILLYILTAALSVYFFKVKTPIRLMVLSDLFVDRKISLYVIRYENNMTYFALWIHCGARHSQWKLERSTVELSSLIR